MHTYILKYSMMRRTKRQPASSSGLATAPVVPFFTRQSHLNFDSRKGPWQLHKFARFIAVVGLILNSDCKSPPPPKDTHRDVCTYVRRPHSRVYRVTYKKINKVLNSNERAVKRPILLLRPRLLVASELVLSRVTLISFVRHLRRSTGAVCCQETQISMAF